MADYNKIGFVYIRDSRILLCRKKRGTSLLILPGGCLEPGETDMDCLHRELREELGDVSLRSAAYIGTYEYRAADAGKTLRMDLYCGDIDGDPVPSSEIAELVWFGEHDVRSRLSPSLCDLIVPDLIQRGILSWR